MHVHIDRLGRGELLIDGTMRRTRAHVWTKINRTGSSAPHLRPASFGGASEHYHHLVDDIALRCHRPTAGGTEPERVLNSFIRCAANTRRGRRSATSLPRD